MGGGGFAMEPENPLLDQYILSQARTPRPKVCFIPTASADSDNFCLRFYEAFAQHNCTPSHLLLFKRAVADLRSFILDKDVIYVGGGNTANMLAIWRVHGMDQALHEAWDDGVVLCGVSAGMNCWFECSVTDSFGLELSALRDGLGLLPGSVCPHYDGEERRRPVYQQLVADGLPPGIAVEDSAGIFYEETVLKEVVAEVDGRRAYRVELTDGKITETVIPTRSLVSPPAPAAPPPPPAPQPQAPPAPR